MIKLDSVQRCQQTHEAKLLLRKLESQTLSIVARHCNGGAPLKRSCYVDPVGVVESMQFPSLNEVLKAMDNYGGYCEETAISAVIAIAWDYLERSEDPMLRSSIEDLVITVE